MKDANTSLFAYTEELLSEGRATFSFQEAKRDLKLSDAALRASVRRLKQKKVIVSPIQKFFVILPPEYRVMGCLPAPHFIPDLMKYLGEKYYACLLSAGEYYGAAHQRPQVFQVMTETPRRQITCGRVRVSFLAKNNLKHTAVKKFNTPRGYISVSTPACTAFDLVGYVKQSGGLDNVATVLAELVENLEPNELVKAAKHAPLAWTQRLGFLLDLVSTPEKAEKLAKFVADHRPEVAGLSPNHARRGFEIDSRWQIAINTDVEPDI